MAIIVRVDGTENRKYIGQCQSCQSSLEWTRQDAKTVVDEEGRRRPHSIIDCPVVLPSGVVCNNEVYGF